MMGVDDPRLAIGQGRIGSWNGHCGWTHALLIRCSARTWFHREIPVQLPRRGDCPMEAIAATIGLSFRRIFPNDNWQEATRVSDIQLAMVSCALCGQESQQCVICSMSSFGASDLDMRPAETERLALFAEVSECPDCGYCSPSLDYRIPGASATIATVEYQRLRANEQIPDLARRFLLLAMLTDQTDRTAAAIARLKAAWACDDENQTNKAGHACRTLAIADFAQIRSFGETKRGVSNGLVYIDMLRRTGRYAESLAMIDMLLQYPKVRGMFRMMLEFQKKLCRNRDCACHTVDEATTP